MIVRDWIRPHLAIGLVALALVACARTAPPAPVVSGGSHAAGAAHTAGTPQPQLPHPDSVIVQPGETLYGIARRYDVPVRSLIEANGLTPPYSLAAGRRLGLPQVHQHIVQPGETLYGISRLYGVDTSTLARSNGLGPPYHVRVGETLILPAPVETATGKAPVIQATPPAPAYAAPAAPASPPVWANRAAPTPAAPSPPAQAMTPPPPALPPSPPQAETKTAGLPPPAPPAAPEAKTAALPPPAASPRSGARTFLWPVHGKIITAYGNGEGGTHNDGINIAAPEGTSVRAADAGTVAYAGNELRGYGNLVLIKHPDGWMTAYAHNAVLLVKRGEKVQRGQVIARVGATGAVGEPQLHFEIRHGTRALDPGEYLPVEAATASRTP